MTLSITMIRDYTECNYVECHILSIIMLSAFAESRYAECCNAECRSAFLICRHLDFLPELLGKHLYAPSKLY
jgi:hypothetical protein